MIHKRLKTSPDTIAGLKLEAIFHPKFENEKPDAEIRRRMLAKVASDEGYLEASIKHSGSLLLWSGRQRFYSKNSTDNIVTRVGEIMLMQHFARCFSGDDDNDWREEYDRCSEFVCENRITCSFELVTSILGHHGDIPKRDYLVLIAAADRGRGRGRFYPTNELVRFAHQFRLPHNDAWMFPSSGACESLFRSYDDAWETGTAATVIERLDRIVRDDEAGECSKVSSLHPHDVFQGDILEGIVIRYVPHAASVEGDAALGCDARRRNFEEMELLSTESNDLLRLVPPSLALDRHSKESTGNLENDTIRQVDLRALAEMDDFELQVESVLRNFHGPNFRNIRQWADPCRSGETTAAAKYLSVVEVANEILSASSNDATLHDRETLDIARLVQTLDRLKISVTYTVLTEKTSEESRARNLCILHVRHDSSFPKYNACLRQEGSGGMMLFRGFSIELVPVDSNFNIVESDAAESSEKTKTPREKDTLPCASESDNTNEEKLMLKMKFLPYMVRTFVCRNGLSILQSSGVSAFHMYAVTQLSKWKVSDASVTKWMPFFRGWAEYCSSPPDTSLPPLSENAYLHHYNEYCRLFANGDFQPNPSDESSFHGLIVIVGPTKRNLEALSLGVSKMLHCSKIVDDVNLVTFKDVLLSMQRTGGGLICVAGIEDRYSSLRKLVKEYHKAIHIIVVEGDLEENSADNNRSKRIKGMTMGWRKIKCNLLLDLPKDAAEQTDVEMTLKYLRTNSYAKTVLSKLKASSKNNQPDDERPGLVVYFPSIPGSGKSSLCQDITAKSLVVGDNRQLVLMEGDEIKNQGRGKFFDVVQKEVFTKPASIAILDKNVPPSSFSSVHTLCIESKSIALPVLPEGMTDTLIGNGATSHVYPFSLQYLAACMARVLRRQPNTHKGKLDASTQNACMIVVKFYCFYRNMSVLALKEKLLSIGYQGKEIVIPFFREKVLVDLPTDMELALKDAIISQTSEDMSCCKALGGGVDMEKRLRSSIHSNQSYIDNLTVSLEESKQAFVSEMSRRILSLPNSLSAVQSKAGAIKIVSLDINYDQVHSEIEKLRKSSQEVEQYFADREEHKSNDEDDKSKNRFIKSVHCTFVHASQATQEGMVSTFQHLLGTSVEIKAISLLFSDEVAAIELEIPTSAHIPRPRNTFPHITIWCAEDSEAYRSNELPEKVKCNSAKRVDFRQPAVMSGVFKFWYD